MGRRIHRDIAIQGRVFATLQDAADHYKCTPENISRMIKLGRTHRIGAGKAKIEPCPVRIRGKVYPSARVAAKKLGVTPSAIWMALSQNRIDRVGLGCRCPNPHRSEPCTLGGITWPSLSAADKALGFPVGTISLARRRGYKRTREKIMAAAMKHAAALDKIQREAKGHGLTRAEGAECRTDQAI